LKRTDEYVDFIYRRTIGNQKDIEELKAEMKAHLLESVEELKAEGYSETQAIKIAIERFGGENIETSVIGELFNTQKVFAKRVLYTGITLLIMSCLLSIFIVHMNNQILQNDASIHFEVESLLSNRDTLSHDEKQQIDVLLDETKLTKSYEYYYLVNDYEVSGADVQLENYTSVYRFEREKSNDNWFFMGDGQVRSVYGDTFIMYEVSNFSSLSTVVLITGVFLFWSMSSIWGIITAYHHRKLNATWVIIIILFNVFGYLFFFRWNKGRL
jgi:cell division protein FtsL